MAVEQNGGKSVGEAARRRHLTFQLEERAAVENTYIRAGPFSPYKGRRCKTPTCVSASGKRRAVGRPRTGSARIRRRRKRGGTGRHDVREDRWFSIRTRATWRTSSAPTRTTQSGGSGTLLRNTFACCSSKMMMFPYIPVVCSLALIMANTQRPRTLQESPYAHTIYPHSCACLALVVGFYRAFGNQMSTPPIADSPPPLLYFLYRLGFPTETHAAVQQ